jgi:hypothetical protein
MNRVAAGVAVAFVMTVTGGAGAAVTSADPGSPRSPSGQSRDGAHSRGNTDENRSQGGSGNGVRRSNDGHGNNGRGGGPTSRGELDLIADDGPSSRVVAQSTTTSSRAAIAEPESPTVAAAVPTVPVPASVPVAAPVSVGGVGTGGGGSAGASVAPRVVPRVIFGDGRSPGLLSAGEPAIAQPMPAGPAPAPVVAPTGAAPAAPTPLTMDVSPWPLSETPVTTFWGKVEPSWPVGVLFGIAGLLLAPIGGVWLGHRQARAAKASANVAILEDRTPTQAGVGS